MMKMIIVMTLQLESSQLEREQQRIELKKLTAEAEGRERCLREELDEKVLFVVSLFTLILCPYSIVIIG